MPVRRSVRLSSCLILGVLLLYGKDPLPPIKLDVDASQVQRSIFHAHLTIPAKPGPLTLLYPKWIPGEHGPTGPITNLTGLELKAAGKRIPWRRDLVEMFAFHCDVPQGADSVEVSLDFLSPAETEDFSGGASTTDKLAVVSWNQVLLYPEGWPAGELTYNASLRLPAGWRYGTALPVAKEGGDVVDFAPVTLNTLVDSPVLTGIYFRTIDLTHGKSPSHFIDIAADSTAALQMPPQSVAAYKKLVAETGALFGARHYRDYHLLLTLSNHVAHFGLEHHQSSDNRVRERTLIEPKLRAQSASLMPHEFVHSWNGKYRRPADLATPDYEQPMKTDLLWVYEGLTTYLGGVLTARSGLWSPEEYKENLALNAALLNHEPGRGWRSLEDTAVAAQLLYDAPKEWASWRRGVDFYDEGALLWLEADVIIRQQTSGQRSLDDFCRAFFGGQSGPPALVTYTFNDVVAALNNVAAYDWRDFFNTRLNRTGGEAPLGGIPASGWRIIYSDKMNDFMEGRDEEEKITELTFSIGLRTKDDGTVLDAIRGMPAEQAGISPGMKIVAVNGRAWSPQVIKDALKIRKNSPRELELEVSNKGFYNTYRLNYRDGNKYPHFERETGKPDLLEQILKPLTN
jgi:predicted metalloprotease with PDZ domain